MEVFIIWFSLLQVELILQWSMHLILVRMTIKMSMRQASSIAIKQHHEKNRKLMSKVEQVLT